MTLVGMHESVLHSLFSRPSRASAAAIGHQFILGDAPPALCVRGLDALSHMVCDWSVAILEEVVGDPGRPFLVRLRTVRAMRDLLSTAIDRGYQGITSEECCQLASEAEAELKNRQAEASASEMQAVEDLASHLSEAVAEGFFEELPDF